MRERRGTRGRRKHKRRKEGGEQNNNRNKLHMHLIYKYTVLNKSHLICQGLLCW